MTVDAARAPSRHSADLASSSAPAGPAEVIAPRSSAPAPAPQSPNAVSAAVEGQHDEAVRRFVEARHDREKPRLGDGVLYVGMNSTDGQCDREAALLARTGSGARRSIGHGERDRQLGADHVRAPQDPKVVVDLGTSEGARAFVAGLGLEAETGEVVIGIVLGAPTGSRDELAALAAIFARGERGEDIPSRIVLSGHCAGDSVYDGAQVLGWLRFADVFALARAMPRAASQIEDLMLSACNSGHRETGDPFRVAIGSWCEPFPNLKTVWAYAGEDSHSPTGEVALRHIEAWELATRGRQERLHPRSAIHQVSGGASVGYEANVSVWSAKDAARLSERSR